MNLMYMQLGGHSFFEVLVASTGTPEQFNLVLDSKSESTCQQLREFRELEKKLRQDGNNTVSSFFGERPSSTETGY